MQIWLAAALLACSAALWKPMSHDRGRVRGALVFLALWAAALAGQHWQPARQIGFALLSLAAVQLGAVLAFDLILRRMRLPKFVSEMLITASYAFILFHLLYSLGVNVTGIFATSAVAAAVVGFALQDMLSNIASGIALELENGIGVGDFIRVGQHSGWVRHVRLRHTEILTPDGDSVIVPNSQLTRSEVQVFSQTHRVFVPFQMSYAHNPQELIDAVQSELRSSPLTGVLADPPAQCVIRQMDAGFIRYAVVVWTQEPGHEAELTSAVLLRLYFALQRSGIAATEISQLLELRRPSPAEAKKLDSISVLRGTPILRLLEESDLLEIASRLKHLSYAPGEHIIRQGEEGWSMYFIAAGSVAITIRTEDGAERAVSVMETGEFFGEASLLTGEKRNANATAKTRVDCYRLDKDALHDIMNRRVELAEDMSVVMAHRQTELLAIREKLDLETALRREAESQGQFLARIRKFFGLAANGAKA